MSAVTQWFDIENSFPSKHGVYQLVDFPIPKCQEETPHYSLWNGKWRMTCTSSLKASVQTRKSIGVASGNYKLWRGL